MSATPLGGTAGKGSFTQALVSPKHLTSLATVHTWPFSAIAELIDNACDPDVLARDLWIDYEKIAGKPCLVFLDNGNGMDLNHLVKMLSFGFCEKDKYEDDPSTPAPIGHYGSGFKSGSMRLAKDALVFTVGKDTKTACIGFLSQTLCHEHNSETLVIPLMEYKRPQLRRTDRDMDMDKALEAILEFSPYNSEKKLKTELKNIMTSESGSGTKIVLFNLKRNKEMLELDFESDPNDIRNPETIDYTPKSKQPLTKIAEHRQSLRVPKMKIHIRKMTVKHVLISGRLIGKETVGYKPKGKDKGTTITFGRPRPGSKKQLDDHGFMLYYRNRLIQPYAKIGNQSKPGCAGVIAVVDVDDILKPTHDKQRFLDNTEYKSAAVAFTDKLYDYCDGTSQSVDEEDERDIWDWVQCDRCRKWRRLQSIDKSIQREKWYCQMNKDLSRNRCEIEQENADDEYDIGGMVKEGGKKRRQRKSGKQGQTPQTDTPKGTSEQGRCRESQVLPTTTSPSGTGQHTLLQPTTSIPHGTGALPQAITSTSDGTVRLILLQPTTSTPSGTGHRNQLQSTTSTSSGTRRSILPQSTISTSHGTGALPQPTTSTSSGTRRSILPQPTISTLHGTGALPQPTTSTSSGTRRSILPQPTISTLHGTGALPQPTTSTPHGTGALPQPTTSTPHGIGHRNQPKSTTSTPHRNQPHSTSSTSSGTGRRNQPQLTTPSTSHTGQHTQPHEPLASPSPTSDGLVRKPLSGKRKQPAFQSGEAEKRVRPSQSDTTFASKREPGTAGPSDTPFAIKLEPGTAGPPREDSSAVSVSSNNTRPRLRSASFLNQRISNLAQTITTVVKSVTGQVKQEVDDSLEVPPGPSPKSANGTCTGRSGELGGRSQPPCCARLRQDLHTLLAYMVQKRMVNVQQIGHVDQVEDTLHSVLRSLGLYSE